uniref:Uncharacterized protein n=1 Tax=Rhizophora mucronata TaxID=61149 RepID=A0A2P2NWA1_RHIMU
MKKHIEKQLKGIMDRIYNLFLQYNSRISRKKNETI